MMPSYDAATPPTDKPGALKRLIFILVIVLVFLALAEVVLRLAGIDADDSAIRVFQTFGVKAELKRDETCIWKNVEQGKTDPDGFVVHRSASSAKTPYTVALCSDSCGIVNDPTYLLKLGWMLQERFPDKAFTLINTSTIGYSSAQGVQVLQKKLLPKYKVDLVVFVYGFNDHWLGPWCTDREALLSLQKNYSSLRNKWGLYLAARKLMGSLTPRPDQRPYRVPLDHYEQNLREAVALCQKHGARLVLATPPHNLDPKTFSSPYKILPPGVSVLELHKSYNEVVRRIGKEKGVFFDLAAVLDRLDKSALFREDQIHLIEPGVDAVASALFGHVAPIIENAGKPSQP